MEKFSPLVLLLFLLFLSFPIANGFSLSVMPAALNTAIACRNAWARRAFSAALLLFAARVGFQFLAVTDKFLPQLPPL